MRLSHALVLTIAVGVITVGALACGSSSGNPATPTTPTQNGGSSAVTGTMTVRLTDSPFSDAKALLVTFSEVSVHSADPGDWTTLPFATGTSRTCDLKQLSGATDVLGVGPLAAGHYTQIRLVVSSATLYFDNKATTGPCAPSIAPPAGASAPVDIPSGEVKLNNEFTVATAGTTMLLDFDGDQSVRQTGNGNGNAKYMMSPVIRVVSVQ